jgi:hypothetical protein
MKRRGWLFLMVLGAAALAWAGPANADTGKDGYDATDLYPISDPNDIGSIDVNDYIPDDVYGVNDGIVDPNDAADAYHEADLSDTGYVSNGEPTDDDASAYDDSNIHSAFDIINPIRVSAGNSGAEQSLTQSLQDAHPTLTSVTIAPASPCSSDTVVVTFTGRKGVNYVVDHVDVTLKGSMIVVEATWRRDSVVDGLIVDYSQSQALGKFSAGTYTLQVRNLYGGRPCANLAKFFTVSAAAASVDTGSLWDLLGSRFKDPASSPFAEWPLIHLLD